MTSSSNAPRVTVRNIRLFERNVRLRLPFRFGVVTLRETPQAFVHAQVSLADGREAWGVAAELLVPKWFDKSPSLSNEENVEQLRTSLRLGREGYMESGTGTTFELAEDLYHSLIAEGGRIGLNSLTATFGSATIARAVLDGLCRALGLSFYDAVRGNAMGLRPEILAPDLKNFDLDNFLAGLSPKRTIAARHTVGMIDPLSDADLAADARVDDGLPETLEQVIGAYGHRYFKIKVRGDLAADLDRLRAIAAVLDHRCDDYRVTLDGNEQYEEVDGIVELWRAIDAEPALARFAQSVLFIEQPLSRAVALDRDVTPLGDLRPVIIDESDDRMDCFLVARARGYAGISSKQCKGLYKSMINAARCHAWNTADGEARYFQSAEDLTCQSGVAVQQDLALVALLGLSHVERNGHHYVNGMAGAPEREQEAFLAAHPTLYHRVGGRVVLNISDGQLDLSSLGGPGFATGVIPDWSAATEMET